MPKPNPIKIAEEDYIHLSRCPVCDSDAIGPYAIRDDDIQVLKCSSCDLRFVEKYPVDLGKWYADDYFVKAAKSDEQIGYEDYRNLNYTYFVWAIAFVNLVKRSGSLFDLGCSNGLFLDLAKQSGFSPLSGVEFNESFAQICRRKGYDVASGDFLSNPFSERRFDVITAWAVLEHIPNLSGTLTLAKKILKDDGAMFFEVPCMIEDEERDYYWLSTSLEHIYYFTPKSLQHAIKRVFGCSYFGRVVNFENYGSTIIGFVSKDSGAKAVHQIVEQALTNLDNAPLGQLSTDHLINLSILYSRYLNDFRSVEKIGSTLGGISSCELQTRFLGYLAEQHGKASRENREYADAKKYFLERIKFLEEQVIRNEEFNKELLVKCEKTDGSENEVVSQIRASLHARPAITVARTSTDAPGNVDQTARIRAAQVARLQKRIEEALKAKAKLESSHGETVRTLESEITHLRNKIAELYRLTDSIWSLKWWRLREALTSSESIFKKVPRVGYLTAALLTPEFLRRPLRPLLKPLRSALHSNDEIKTVKLKPWPAERPLVSVIMPSYNYGRYMPQALESVYRQTFQDFELVIVDCSDDPATLDFLKSVTHPKVRILYRGERHQLGDNRNYGIKNARGKYVCCFDPDDIMRPTYLEKAVYYLETYNCDISAPSLTQFGDDEGSWTLPLVPYLDELIRFNCISVIALFSKAIWEKAQGFHDYGRGEDHVHEDWDFWIRAMAVGARVRNVQESLMLYRKHSCNMSADKKIPSLDAQRKKILSFNQKFLTQAAIARSRRLQRQTFDVQNPHVNLLRSQPEDSCGKHILFALPFTVAGGAEKRFIEIGELLKDSGCQLSVFTTVAIDPKQHDTSSKFEKLTDHVYHLPRFLPERERWEDFLFYYLRSRKVDYLLLGGSQFFYDLLPKIKAEFPEIRVIDQQFNTSIHFENNRRFASQIDFTVAENETVHEALKASGEPDSRMALVHNGVDVNQDFTPAAIGANRPDELPLNKTIVSFVGRLSEEKGPDLFIEIARALADNPDLFFVLAGPGLLDGKMEELIKEAGLKDRFSVPGYVDSRQYLAATDILVVPSRLDGRPNVILEALALGRPIVASAVGGIPGLITDGITGFLCEPEDVDAFAQRVALLASQPELRTKLSNNGRDFAVKNLDRTALLSRYLDFFGLPQRKPPAAP